MKIATSQTARMQHAKSRSMLRKNDTVCWEQKMSVTKRQADMVPAFQGMSANPDLEHHADAVFGICDGLQFMSISPNFGTSLLIDLA